jgi:hypothetical protein
MRILLGPSHYAWSHIRVGGPVRALLVFMYLLVQCSQYVSRVSYMSCPYSACYMSGIRYYKYMSSVFLICNKQNIVFVMRTLFLRLVFLKRPVTFLTKGL